MGGTTLQDKLGVCLEPATDAALDFLLKATSRIVGKASLLHCGYRELSDPFAREMETMKTNSEKLERSFWYLNEKQRNLLLKVNDKTSEVKNFCFVGGSGTGKTQMALEVIKKLLDRYKDLNQLIISLCSTRRS